VEALTRQPTNCWKSFFAKGDAAAQHIGDGLKVAGPTSAFFPDPLRVGDKEDRARPLLSFWWMTAVARLARGQPVDSAAKADVELPYQHKIGRLRALGRISSYKTVADPVGPTLVNFKVIRHREVDARVDELQSLEERMSHLAVLRGKEQTPIPDLHAGELGVAKLKPPSPAHSLAIRNLPVFLNGLRDSAGAAHQFGIDSIRARRKIAWACACT